MYVICKAARRDLVYWIPGFGVPLSLLDALPAGPPDGVGESAALVLLSDGAAAAALGVGDADAPSESVAVGLPVWLAVPVGEAAASPPRSPPS